MRKGRAINKTYHRLCALQDLTLFFCFLNFSTKIRGQNDFRLKTAKKINPGQKPDITWPV